MTVTFGTDGKGGSAKGDVKNGESTSLGIGEGETLVYSVTAVHGQAEEIVTPKVTLPVGKRYRIVIDADGKPQGTLSDN